MHRHRYRTFGVFLLLFASLGAGWAATTPSEGRLRCDRQMRKTFESIQAWRRLHGGRYPDRLVDLEFAGLLPYDGGICPEVLGETAAANPTHHLLSSRNEGGDPDGLYEYEMSDKVDILKDWMPPGAPPFTRQQLKSVLLRRPFYEQIPILRCSSHRANAPREYTSDGSPFRNLTVDGTVYWSGKYWEKVWLADVPYCCRDANVLFGLKGPPFHTDRAPTLQEALDLRPWSCAFGDHPWWWTYPMFDEQPNFQKAADLRPFFEERHGRIAEVGGTKWWLDGLVQLQGKILTGETNRYRGPGLLSFLWERRGLPVGRTFHKALWLQGTVWTAPPGQAAGWLVWRYSDGGIERVPVTYGKTTARFWADQEQARSEKDFAQPVWQHHQTAAEVGKERWLRLYQQTWTNPRPNTPVASLDFVTNPNSPAAPFLIAVNLLP